MEKLTEYINLKKIVHRVYCDNCNVELKRGNMAHATAPPTYQHICPQCNKEYWYYDTYPWAEIVGDEVNEMGYATSL